MFPFSSSIHSLFPTSVSVDDVVFHLTEKMAGIRREHSSVLYLSDQCVCPTNSCFPSVWPDLKLAPLSLHCLHRFLGTYGHCFSICPLSFLEHLFSFSARSLPTNIQIWYNFLYLKENELHECTLPSGTTSFVCFFLCCFVFLLFSLQNFCKILTYIQCVSTSSSNRLSKLSFPRPSPLWLFFRP